MRPAEMTASELKRRLDAGEISSEEVLRDALEVVRAREPEVQAFLHVRPEEELLAEARAVDARRAAGEAVGPLAGLPVAVKDNICTKGLRTSCASRILENYVPPYDATVVTRLREADGILLGKTNMDEFAMGSSTEHSAFQKTRNPHDPERVPGGSSGGSAAAVAAGEAVLALGSDTGGSIRQPAALCGVVGMKPTYGRVSRYGLVAYGSSLDQIGPLARSVADADLLYRAIAGHDAMDSTSLDAPAGDAADPEAARRRRFRVGVPRAYLAEGCDPEIVAAVEGVVERLEAAGSTRVDVALPHADYAIAAYYLCACAEASSNLARYDGCHYGLRVEGGEGIVEMMRRTRSAGFGAEVKRRIMLGTFTLSSGFYDAYYLKAMKTRRLIADDFEKAFEACDILVHPVTPTPAFRIGEKVHDPLAMYLLDIYTVTGNLAGIPAVSVPCGRTESGLPIGVQIAAKQLDEDTLLAAALQVEEQMP
jgi:aspartyl-tRNA(Asn)/glutamyl-tRNA(Gln) amidotransferase subunit A